jgi:predicted ATPase
VGRQAEMESLKRAAEQAKAGHGQIAAAMAEAGVGKSRLFYEFKVTTQSGWMVLETFSVSHGKASAYLPVIDLLHGYFEIKSEDDRRKRREKVTGRVLALDRSLEDTLPYLFGLLGLVEGEDPLAQMDAQVKKRRTLDAIKRILLRESLNQPLMVIFEDLHWIDNETQALLSLLADGIGTAKILLLVNYRPEYTHQWGSKTYYTQLRLDPLGRESAEEMLTALVGDGAEVRPLKRLIIERTEGNPFFMEETVQVLLDEGALVRDGTVKLTKPLSELKIPPTVQAILAARIDRLPPAEKDLLQTLAVIGKEFQLRLVREVTRKTDDELGRMLDDLQLAEFIYEQPAVGDVEYTFKHALTLEVAYNSVLSERRRMLHERAGAAIETLYAANLDDHANELAHHYSRSANAEKAAEYLSRAAQQALDRSAFTEALDHLMSALERLKPLPETLERARRELDVQLALADAWAMTKGPPSAEAGQAWTRARELCGQTGDTAKLFRVLSGMRLSHMLKLQLAAARQLGEQALELAEQAGDAAMLASAHASLAAVLSFCGDFAAARGHYEQALSDPEQPLRSFIAGESRPLWLVQSALALQLLGYPEKALKLSQEALTRARDGAQPFPQALCYVFAAHLHQLRRDPHATQECAEAAIAVATELGSVAPMVGATVFRGWALAELGQALDGIAEIRRSSAIVPSTRLFALLAAAQAKAGQVEEGLKTVGDALERVAQTGDRQSESDLWKAPRRVVADGERLQRAGSPTIVPHRHRCGPRTIRQVVGAARVGESCAAAR